MGTNKDYIEYVHKVYDYLHTIPEKGFEEYKTSEFVLKELEKIKEYLRDEISLDNIEEYHRPWALELKKKFDYLKSSTDLNDFVNKELSNKFVSVLEHCGVFKLNEEGLEGFKRFTNSLNS